MAVAMKAEAPSLRGRVSDAEWRMRIELAACCRLVAHCSMTDRTELVISSPEVCERTARHFDKEPVPERDWKAHLRLLDGPDPSCAS